MTEPTYPEALLYHPDHAWARVDGDGDVATFGITWFAQDQLGEVLFFDARAVTPTVAKDAPYTEVESVKSVSDVIAPLSGEVLEINGALADEPEALNDDPYGRGWTVKVRLSAPAERRSLLDRDSYVALVDG